ILNKPGPLTRNELEVVQMHPIWGIELLASVEFPWDLKPIIRWHHERYDGTGYPDRLRGDEITLSSHVVGIADVYDALTTARPYRGMRHAARRGSAATHRRSRAHGGTRDRNAQRQAGGDRQLRRGGDHLGYDERGHHEHRSRGNSVQQPGPRSRLRDAGGDH